jgi:hypothetical protein
MIEDTVRNGEGIYTWTEDGVPQSAPSVSLILKPLDDYGNVNSAILGMAQERGTAIHFATELYDQGTLDTDSLHEAIVDAVFKWVKFRRETGFEPLFIEKFVRSKVYRFAGRLDRLGYFPEQQLDFGRKVIPESILVLDIKSGLNMPLKLGPQTAGYRQAALETITIPEQFQDLPVLRMVVQLDSPGDRALWELLLDENDWPVFQSCANIWHFKRRRRGR